MLKFLLDIIKNKKNNSSLREFAFESIMIISSIPLESWPNIFDSSEWEIEDELDWNFLNEMLKASEIEDFTKIKKMKYKNNNKIVKNHKAMVVDNADFEKIDDLELKSLMDETLEPLEKVDYTRINSMKYLVKNK